ncbi:MAG: GNAT family N-acetyltransferase [Clostridia bacterium]|nr:GNAT family N-acetyltransferase [Clostridia bacterium]
MNLTIRKMNKNDLEPLHELLSEPRVMKFLEPPYTKEKTKQFLMDAGLCDPPRVFAVDRGGTFIGYVIFHDYDDVSFEIGWVLHPLYWGNGYASHLTELLIGKGQELHKQLVIECVPEQEVTKHLAMKYGFDYDGRTGGLDVFRRKR